MAPVLYEERVERLLRGRVRRLHRRRPVQTHEVPVDVHRDAQARVEQLVVAHEQAHVGDELFDTRTRSECELEVCRTPLPLWHEAVHATYVSQSDDEFHHSSTSRCSVVVTLAAPVILSTVT